MWPAILTVTSKLENFSWSRH